MMERGVEGVPETLDRETPLLAQWCSERLVLSQCCGSDLFLLEPPALQPVARPVFSGLDCEPGDYYSYIAAPVKRYATVRAAINNIGSRSGHLALAQWLAARRHDVAEVIVTGSHAASLEALRRGDADIAAIDAFSWRVVDTRGVETLGRRPRPPFRKSRRKPGASRMDTGGAAGCHRSFRRGCRTPGCGARRSGKLSPGLRSRLGGRGEVSLS